VSILGAVHLDASAGAGPDAQLIFIGIFGDLMIRIPSGSRVRTSEFTIFGDPRVEVSQGRDRRSACRVSASSAMWGSPTVDVTGSPYYQA
jgi:hypothetical protein